MSERDDERDREREEEEEREEREREEEEEREEERTNEGQPYRLTIPLDAAHLEELREEKPQALRAVLRLEDETLVTGTVELDDGEGSVELELDGRPGDAGLYLGSADATPEELVKSQTLTVDLPAARWADTRTVELEPIRIPAYYWRWWYRWCRTFTVSGRLVCPDGSPVPGAEVCAKDVDAWFYWSSTEEVGCDTTDENGVFEIEFRWCCGFWPWWWWQNRRWRPDAMLVDRIGSVVEETPDLTLKRGTKQPSLAVFDDVLEDPSLTDDRPLPELDPDGLERVRDRLVDRLPEVEELRRLRVWPWVRWQPWWDCTPDLIFEATQAGEVVLEEDIGDTRWDVSTSEEVTLTANEEALCRGDCRNPPCPGGECLLVTQVCRRTIDRVGGNLGAPAAPEGYLNPGPGYVAAGSKSYNGDLPFAGTVRLDRNVGTLQNVDYLEFEVDDGSGWTPVPPDAVEDFRRRFYDTSASGPAAFGHVSFDFDSIDGHYVVETREHYEANSGFTWDTLGADRFWISNRNLLVPIDSEAFSDGTYRFRAVGWEETGGGEGLTERRVIPLCDDDDERDAEVVLTFDNRLNPDPTHPTTHPSGSGTVHQPVTEPDTDIIAVRIDGQEVAEDEDSECPVVERQDVEDRTLQIDFLVHDQVDSTNPTGHLSHYTLVATYGRNKKVDLLDKRTSLDPLPPGSGSPPYPGPTYGEALGQGASRPHWEGVRFRLEIPLDEAFPKNCCYQLELRGYKRTIVNCSGNHPHRNRSEYTIGYGV